MPTFKRLRHALSCLLPCRGCASSHSRTPEQSSCLQTPASMRAMTPPAQGRTPEARERPPQGRCSAPYLGPRPCFPLRSCAAPLPPPILLGLPLHSRRLRVLEFQPVLRSAGAIARAEPLRHDAFEAHLASVPEYALAIVGEVPVQTQPPKAPTQQARERRPARLQRLAPQVFAIQLKEVEGVEEDMLARRLAPQPLEHREPVLIAGDGLAVDQARADLEPVNGLEDERVARRPIVPVPG